MIYELAHIYIIWDIEDQNLTYYGSTCDLKTRMRRHKDTINNRCSSRQIINRKNYEYAILETHENIDKYDLHERERWYILNKPCINKTVPWNQNAKEKMKEKFVCECGGNFTYRNKVRHKKTQKHLKWIQSCKI